MTSYQRGMEADVQEIGECHVPSKPNIELILSELQASLQFPWFSIPQEDGINVLLFSRDHQMSVQRRAFFSFDGSSHICVHRKPINEIVLEGILMPDKGDGLSLVGMQHSTFVQHIVTVVHRLQSYEVCVGVNDTKFIHVWHSDQSGEIDTNPYGELRYKKTFRPFKCHLLVSTAGYLRQRCSVCIKTRIRFAMKVRRHRSDVNPTTPNVHLDRCQLLTKVIVQQKKLKHSRTKLDRLKAAFEQALSDFDLKVSECVSEQLLEICMDYTEISE